MSIDIPMHELIDQGCQVITCGGSDSVSRTLGFIFSPPFSPDESEWENAVVTRLDNLLNSRDIPVSGGSAVYVKSPDVAPFTCVSFVTALMHECATAQFRRAFAEAQKVHPTVPKAALRGFGI